MDPSSIHNPYLRRLAYEIVALLSDKVSSADLAAALSEGTIENTANLILTGITSKLGVRTIPEYALDINGESRIQTLQLTGGTTTYLPPGNNPVDEQNRTNTYIAFGEAGAVTDCAYLRQIGTINDNMHIALDFHDTYLDGRFSVRNVHSLSDPDGTINTLWTTQHDRTTFYQNLAIEKSGTGADSQRVLKVQKDSNYVSLSPYASGWNDLADWTKKDKLLLFSDNSSVNQTSRLVIGPHTTSGLKRGVVIGNDGMEVYGKQVISEAIGTSASALNGSLVIRHENSWGKSSIVFPSGNNGGSDYGYIEYRDSYDETNVENSVLIIGVENDATGNGSDSIRFRLNGAERVTLHGDGSVGIGTTDKNVLYKLNISGSLNCSSFVYENGAKIASIGVNQSWNDVTYIRAKDTWYENTSGRPKQVMVSCINNNSGNQSKFALEVGYDTTGLYTVFACVAYTNNDSNEFTLTAIIPPSNNKWYRVRKVSGNNTNWAVETWSELG